MSSLKIQGLSGYQMQLQSLINKTQALTSKGDNASMAFASALRQQASNIQAEISTTKSSNDNSYVKNNLEKKFFQNYTYNKNLQKEQVEASTFDITI
ncbi:MAG: hypothetical protein K6B41_04295 [Butyrivibrio sp.]|nr:hypothetical protein [Butyrivibrio sp.]